MLYDGRPERTEYAKMGRSPVDGAESTLCALAAPLGPSLVLHFVQDDNFDTFPRLLSSHCPSIRRLVPRFAQDDKATLCVLSVGGSADLRN